MKYSLGLLLFVTLLYFSAQVRAQQNLPPSEIAGKLNMIPVNGIFTQMEGKQNLKGNVAKFIHSSLEKQLHAVLA
ncbi:MAG: hypothetical protein ACRDE2_15220, partial [Chitinophagaceae bacterium]